MLQPISIGLRLLLGALSVTLSGAALAADTPIADPLKELVGKWYGIHENVVYEVKANGDVIVSENKSVKASIKHEKYTNGLVIARLGAHKYQYGQYVFTGQCWTVGGGKPDYWLQPCSEVAMAYYETRGKKPYWKLTVNQKGMLRKENQAKGQGWE